ncbi:sorting nexin-2-like isoform X2 [Limulus polyphemus]|uniref:Sorting nexin-2-like isoform X2 n=1 Tax=Limulus polyphemus TaxID=6850 RepID=A0ABM1B7X1_LIMPO|nr:sorting nexin-2-like isoform X2 [Limulus polyphemus]
MADSLEPPLFNGSACQKDDESEDFFSPALESQSFENTTTLLNNYDQPRSDDNLANLMKGGGEEVCLDDDASSVTPQTKLEFCTPEEEAKSPFLEPFYENKISEPSAPAEITPTEPPISAAGKTPDELIEEENSNQFLKIIVKEPQRVGDGMGAYMRYKVVTKTNLPYFKHKNLVVHRRFSDFLGLHDKLMGKHLRLGRMVPPAPEKSVIGMTKIKMNKEESLSSSDFIEKRRAALERYLNRTSGHPVLRMDPDFREFLELESELPRATNTSALSGAGVMRLFSRVGESVSKMTFKMDESDPWFEEKQHHMENLEQQLRKLHNSVEALVHHRKELCNNTNSFAKSAAMLGNCEEHTALSRALSQLAEVEEKVEQVHMKQVNSDFFMLSEMLKDYIALIGTVKDVFHQRVKVYQTWQHAQQMLTKKREQKAKLELAGKSDKIAQAHEEVIEWEAKVERGQEEFENISKMIRKEVEHFENCRIRDFKDTIVKYMESLLNNQQELIKYWEAFLPQAKAIS